MAVYIINVSFASILSNLKHPLTLIRITDSHNSSQVLIFKLKQQQQKNTKNKYV